MDLLVLVLLEYPAVLDLLVVQSLLVYLVLPEDPEFLVLLEVQSLLGYLEHPEVAPVSPCSP